MWFCERCIRHLRSGEIKQDIEYICSLQRPVIPSSGTAFCVKRNVLKYSDSAVMLGNESAPEGPCMYSYVYMSHDNSVGTATRYGLDGPGFVSRWCQYFPHPSRPALGLHPASCTVGAGSLSLSLSLPGARWPGRGLDHPTPSIADGEERVDLYLYSALGPRRLLQDKLYSYVFRNVGRSRLCGSY